MKNKLIQFVDRKQQKSIKEGEKCASRGVMGGGEAQSREEGMSGD